MSDAPVFVSGDLAGIGADVFGEAALGPGVFFAEFFDWFAEGHVVASRLVTSSPFCGVERGHVCYRCLLRMPLSVICGIGSCREFGVAEGGGVVGSTG